MHDRGDHRRPGSARALSAAVRDGGEGWRRCVRHVLVQLGQRTAYVREQASPHGRAARSVGIHGLRAVRLLRGSQRGADAARRNGSRDAGTGHRQSAAASVLTSRRANLNAALADGQITVADIDTALSRRYTQMFRLGIFDRPVAQTPIDAAPTARSRARSASNPRCCSRTRTALLPLDARHSAPSR